jgi:butyrate kinase
MKILAVDPGSTSTKIAVYNDRTEVLRKTFEHPAEKTDRFKRIIDQFSMREAEILAYLKENNVDLSELSAVVGRGGMLPPLSSGAYIVNDRMIDQMTNNPISEHASNLGALIAHEIASPLGIPAYIYDPVSVDELSDIARISGLREIPRISFSHALNSRAMAIKISEKYGRKYTEMNIITAHLGGGITMSIHENGRMIDIIDDDEGPFSPERSGRVSCKGLTALCFSGKYDKREILRKLRGQGGLKDYLNTSDVQEVERMIAAGNKAHLRSNGIPNRQRDRRTFHRCMRESRRHRINGRCCLFEASDGSDHGARPFYFPGGIDAGRERVGILGLRSAQGTAG